MKKLFVILFLLACPAQSYGLSCAPPIFDESVIKTSEIIFEGKLVALSSHSEIGCCLRFDKETFKVTKAWKGVNKGDRITILRNSYWERGPDKGGNYLIPESAKEYDHLIATSAKEGDYYVAPACKNTAHHFHTLENIKKLEKYFTK